MYYVFIPQFCLIFICLKTDVKYSSDECKAAKGKYLLCVRAREIERAYLSVLLCVALSFLRVAFFDNHTPRFHTGM